MASFAQGRTRSEYAATKTSKYIVTTSEGRATEYGHVTNELNTINAYSTEMTRSQLKRAQRDSGTISIEPDLEVSASQGEANAPYGLDRIDQRANPLDHTYNFTQTGMGVDVYIVDTGINFSNIDFGGRAHEFYDNAGDGGMYGQDCNGHGTHVAGIVGGTTYGVAKQVNLLSVRVLGCDASGNISNVIAAIEYITIAVKKGKGGRHNPAVVNISLTAGGASPSMETAIENAIASGITFVIAAGNSSSDACNFTPARTPDAITVGATDSASDLRWLGSNYGACVDIFAPGLFIPSDYIGSSTATATLSGTSMASPHVAGVAALYLENHRRARPAEVANAIKSNATPGVVGQPGDGSPNLLLYSGVNN
jgi:subtilisin family serine protease